MSRYAANTSVSTDKSLAEIMATVQRYGATGFMTGWEEEGDTRKAMVQFKASGRYVRFLLPLPSPNDPEFKRTPKKRQWRSPEAAHAAWEQACRQRWRALALAIKAKLEAVEAEITTFEEEFLSHIVLPDGSTVGQRVIPSVENAYLTGTMRPLLPEWQGDTVEGELVDEGDE